MFSRLSSEGFTERGTAARPRGRSARPRSLMSGHQKSRFLIETLQKEMELYELEKTYREREQVLTNCQQRVEELQKTFEATHELPFKLERLLKVKESDEAEKRAEREIKEVTDMEAELERLKEESEELTKRREELQSQIKKYLPHKNFVEQIWKLTQFEDMDALTGYWESLLHLRQQLYEKESQVQEHVEQQKKVLLTLEDQQNLLWLLKSNQLFQLQTELEEARREALVWERRWDQILETAAKKTLNLGRVKTAVLNIYEMTGGTAGAGGVDNTETQLEQIKTFVLDQTDIVRQYQTSVEQKAKRLHRNEENEPF